MDSQLLSQLQFYTPPEVIKKIFQNEKVYYKVAKHIIDREYRSRPQKWKAIAFPEYDDFFQAAISGYNPYKKNVHSKDKGLLQAIQTYDPYKRNDLNQLEVVLQVHNDIEQAFCPHCIKRGEEVSLWPNSAGNSIDALLSPDPLFYKGNKYCGRVVDETNSNIESWLALELVRSQDGKILCNFKNRLTSIKNYISSQIGYLIQDIRSAEYHNSRSIKKHPFYPCPVCNTLNPDYSGSAANRPEFIDCTKCSFNFSLKDFSKKSQSKIVWQTRGNSLGDISLDNLSDDGEGRSTYEDVISNYSLTATLNDQAVHHNMIEIEKSILIEKLISRIRELALESLTTKQHQKLLDSPDVVKTDGVPETQNFQIFYNYFFMDDKSKKIAHDGKARNKADESSTYRELALTYLKKEQHYTKCYDCSVKMYEPTESSKFKKSGPHTFCIECNSTNIKYHSPKCGTVNGLDPKCREHGNVEIVMYIFQTIEPKIRRLEELVKKDLKSLEIYNRIKELTSARSELDTFQDMIKLLNY